MQAFVRCASRRWLELSLAVLPLLSAFTTTPLRAQSREGQSTTPEKNVATAAEPTRIAALTVEGGGTLGAYEAGLTWALIEIFRQRRLLPPVATPGESAGQQLLRGLPLFDFRAAAGASAGSINAFIAASRWCSKDSARTERTSPFWKVWIPTGISELLPKQRPADWETQKAVFTRDSFTGLFAGLDSSLDSSSYAPDCSLAFGASITRLADDSLGVTEQVYARNQRYAAGFAIKSKGQGEKGLEYSRLESTNARIRLGAFVGLPDSVGQKVIARESVHELIKASSGFPLAFAPQPVSYCAPHDNSTAVIPGKPCPPGMKMRRSYFIDGGVFDNGPLTIAYALGLAGAKAPSLDSLYMLFVTPSRCRSTRTHCAFVGGRDNAGVGQRTPAEGDLVESQSDGLDAVAKMMSAAIPSARQYELQIASRMLPAVQDADKYADTAKAAREYIKREAVRQFSELLEAARTDVAYLQIVNDSLRNALSRCHQHGDCFAAAESASPTFRTGLRTDWLSAAPSAGVLDAQAGPVVALSRQPYGKFLYVTERWHPLAGDWLFGFGGFIGKPLREYDFYVGVYDALALVARRVSPDVQKGRTDFPDELKKLVTDPPIIMSPTARVAVRALYNVEFSGRSTTGISLNDITGSGRPSVSDSLMLAIVDAMHEMSDSLPPAKKCRGGPIERMECSEGIDVAFAAMRRAPHFKRGLRAARIDCEGDPSQKEDCKDDSRFDDFVAEPYSALNRLTGSILERLLDATPHKSALKMPLTVMSAAYFATNERARTGLDQGSVSLPPSLGPVKRKLMWLIPSSVGGYAGIPGWYYEWAGRYHVNPATAIGATTRLVWASGLGGPASPHGRHTVPSIRVEHKFGGAGALWVSTFGLDLAYWADWRHHWLHGGFRPTTIEKKAVALSATSALFAQKVRVSLGYRPTKYVTRTNSKSRVLFSIGAGDVTGTGYWLVRGLRQKFSAR